MKTFKTWITLIVLIMTVLSPMSVKGATLKLADAPLAQLIELYAKETGHNVFLDESVQSQRKVTAHLNDLELDDAFKIVLKTINLETCLMGSNTVIVFPPEKSNRYQTMNAPITLSVPEGSTPEWLSNLLRSAMPGIRTSILPGQTDKLVIVGSTHQIAEAQKMCLSLPKTYGTRKIMLMPISEAKLAIKELPLNNALVTEGGLSLPEASTTLQNRIRNWRSKIKWGDELFTPENLDYKQIEQITVSLKSRASVSNLGNTSSCLIEGPKLDRLRLKQILTEIDSREKVIHKEIILGDIDAEEAKKAILDMLPLVKVAGERNLMLSGKQIHIKQAEKILETLGRQRKQVLITFKLAEISHSKLKSLGIDLDKSAYTYDEIKKLHTDDTLPLILRLLDEGKDAKILAKPNLRVIEGEEAKVTIGDRIPLEVEATATTDSGSLLKLNTQLEWVDVGIKMIVNDVSVGSDRSISMKIRGEVSSVISQTKQGYPQIRTREAESMLRVQDGGSMIMGGLISTEEREIRSRIPIIGDIPFFGRLGQNKDREKVKSEIIMIVTAKLIEE